MDESYSMYSDDRVVVANPHQPHKEIQVFCLGIAKGMGNLWQFEP
ncbi:hypothetical protein CCACVL1_07199 [Corchorus capsularis]|uniref:Uncharacterized protein n=1 Tax=Corchorus capsularis TaxID=210143 RepID=A0A1R3J8N0_COCAP|nr:hypothetical protein CCACVL1_07199 [Corchorus capsularis]